jgi:hypothetical protein
MRREQLLLVSIVRKKSISSDHQLSLKALGTLAGRFAPRSQ